MFSEILAKRVGRSPDDIAVRTLVGAFIGAAIAVYLAAGDLKPEDYFESVRRRARSSWRPACRCSPSAGLAVHSGLRRRDRPPRRSLLPSHARPLRQPLDRHELARRRGPGRRRCSSTAGAAENRAAMAAVMNGQKKPAATSSTKIASSLSRSESSTAASTR